MKVFVACAILAIVGSAAALQCFTCNSAIDSACSDEFKFDSPALLKEFNKTCHEEEGTVPFCRKIKTWIDRVHNETEARVSRDCGYRRRINYDCYQKRSEDYVLDTCQCDGDFCNGAPTSVASVLALTVPFFTRFL